MLAAVKAALPIELPGFAINPLSLKMFNSAYYRAGALSVGRKRVHYAPFFYPLDAVRNWNRAYGRRGFFQYQCVVPRERDGRAIRTILSAIAGTKGDALLVAVAAPPVDGAANEAVVETLAAALGVPKRSVEILRGETSRTKLVAVHGLDEAELLRRLAVSG